MVRKQNAGQYIKTGDLFRLKPLLAYVRLAIAGGLFVGSVSSVRAELPVPSQVWATMGSATNHVSGDTLRVDQHSDRAILNWEKFNVGAKNQVQFHQPNSASIALNRIFQNDPSQILGKVTANGQIYLYNKNGFVFGKDSTVNANTLVASTLDISDEVFKKGIIREFDETGNAALQAKPNDPQNAAIQVDKGAKVHVGKNGRLIMAAPTVNNSGSLTADEQGQIIVVASKDKVYLQPADNNSPFAGLLVEVGSGGKVSNMGEILARQGNVSLAGFAVNQGGRVTATTSVNVNGSIRLLAREAAEKQSDVLVATKTDRRLDLKDGLGTESRVTFAPGSVTQIVADKKGGAAIDEQDQPASYLEVSANTVHMQSGSTIAVPSGKVDMTVTDDLLDSKQGSKGRILLDKGALINVSGTQGVSAPINRNVVEVPVQSFELRDAPEQRGGVLQGQTIHVDIRKDTKIVDTSGAEARFERKIDERLGDGGEINLTSSGDVIVNNGATVNIAGGSVDFQDGYIKTTKLLTDYGRIVDISDADPNERYVSVFGVVKEEHSKWGVSKIWDTTAQFGQGRFEQGYTEGKDAGSLNITAPHAQWNGELIAGSTKSLYQRTTANMPAGGSFTYDATVFNSTQGVLFQTEKNVLDVGLADKFPQDATNHPLDLVLSTALANQSGLQNLTVKTLGNVTVAPDAEITMATGSQFKLEAGTVNVKGGIYSAGGGITLASVNNGIAQDSGNMNLDAGSVLDVSGRWVNDFEKGLDATPTEPLAIDGGTVKLTATGDLAMNAGSAIRADGGAWLGLNTKLTAGKGGAISLAATGSGGKPSLLQPNGELSAYGLFNNGSLGLSSGKIIVGSADSAPGAITPLVLGESNGKFAFAPNLGFSEINLTSNFDDLTVKGNTSLNLVAQNRVLQNDFRQVASSKSLTDFSHIETLPEHLRRPVDLSLTGLKNVILETGSHILADKQASISLASTEAGIYVDGSIAAPAGAINLAINADPAVQYNSAQAIWLGKQGQLLATGSTRMNPADALGRRSGNVLDGGEITLSANRGYVILEQGSRIEVSGTHAVLDLPGRDASTPGIRYNATEIGSNAGKIALTAAEGAVLDGSLKGLAGSATTRSGRLDVSLDRQSRNEPPLAEQQPGKEFPVGPMAINVRQTDPEPLNQNITFGNVVPANLNGRATLSSDKIAKGGFYDVRLSSPDEVKFQGDVTINTQARIDIDAQKVSWEKLGGAATGAVNLNTAYLRMGSSLVREINALPTLGAGTFTANAQWLELGGASLWNGFSRINLNSTHDLRTVGIRPSDSQRDFIGALVTAANLNLKASQIYPSTLTNFTFAVKNNPEGQITLAGNNTDKTPLSAAGVLNFAAPVINQNGILKAPFGAINLTAGSSLTLGKGSLTSVSGAGQLVPFGVTQGGLDWLYPLDSFRNLVFNTPPEKKLNLSAPEVTLAKGSVVDLSGGGDLLAYEFLPGSGGSYDYLQPGSTSYQGGFAVLPTLGSSIAPFDHLQSTNFKFTPGSNVYLSGTDKLPAGEYTVLPARYALLPGAFLVTPQANTQDQISTTYTPDGLPIVAGYQAVAGTTVRDARWSGFLIEQGSDIRKHSEYEEQTANHFYAARALKNETSVPLLPMDSGQISIAAQNKLILESDFKVATQKGRGARMDIAADQLKIVNNLSAKPTAGTLEVLAKELDNLSVDSLLLGGTRSSNAVTGATDLNVTASDVIFDTGTRMQVTDMIAAAKNQVEVNSRATLVASGKVNTGDSLLNVAGDGALLRISSDKQVTLNRTSAPGSTGELLIAQGATLNASGSMLLDASKSTTLAGNIKMEGGSLNLSANAINIGKKDDLSGSALNLSNEKLQNLSVHELVLNSRDTINFYGNANVGQIDNKGKFGFDRLVMNAAGFSGFGSAGQTVKLQADSLLLQNTLASVPAKAGTGQGNMDIIANHYVQGDGDFSINGFNKINANVANDFGADGKGVLKVGADLNLTTGFVTAAGGSNIKIDASGHNVQMNDSGRVARPISTGFGGAMDIVANAIDLNTKVPLPSGSLGLHALTGDVSVGLHTLTGDKPVPGKADIDLAGRAVNFADTVEYTPGGTFRATADNGNITLAKGSKLDLSTGGGSASGGTLSLEAAKHSVALLGQLKATSGQADIDVSGFDVTASFDGLMNTLRTAGISDSIYFRSRNADIVQATSAAIKTNAITLIADKGKIDLSGTLDANAAKEGGSIKLYAGDKIALGSGATLTTKGTGKNATGGQILLSSVDSDTDGTSGIEIKEDALIDVSGSTQETGGEVTLRAQRVDSNHDGRDDAINIQPIAGTVQGFTQKTPVLNATGQLQTPGYSKFYAEGVKKYGNSDFAAPGQINDTDIAKIKEDADAYMTTANMLKVSKDLGKNIRLRAGVEIDYNGDLTLGSKWDFADWRYNESTNLAALPGTLTIKATGTLALDNSISDGFKDGILASSIPVTDLLQTGDSWSYQLTAGADQLSADTAATVAAEDKASANDLVIGANTTVRTGTGDIQLGANGNIVFSDQTSTVYNAGRPENTARYGTLSNDVVGYLFYSEYPVDGGDLIIKAGNDIKGAISNQFIDNWLVRQGSWTNNNSHTNEIATAWGVALGYTAGVGNIADADAPLFQQNVGSFGGGKVNISAARNINDLSVMMPTSGKQIGEPKKGSFSDFLTNVVQIQGGGEMHVTAGGDIAGGAYFLGKGNGTITAGGDIKGGEQFNNGPQLVMGDSNLALSANKGIALSAVSDAMMLHSGKKSVAGGADTNFFSYTDKSGLALQSLAGDVHLGADTSVIGDVELLSLEGNQLRLSEIYPASLQAAAFGGSVLVDNEITLFPSASSTLSLLANQNISSNVESLRVSMSDADRALLPSAVFPLAKNNLSDTEARLNPFGIPALIHAAVPVHNDDQEPARVVTQAGDINNIQFNLPKKAIVQAGRDLSNALIAIQHVNKNDASILSADRDIQYTSERSPDGGLAGNVNKIEIAGPGDVLVKAGRNIDLGASVGLSTVGNVFNQNLASGGANLSVLAGLNTRNPDYAAFFDVAKYADNYVKFKTLVTGFMRERSSDKKLTETAALAKFRQLNASDYASIQPKLDSLTSKKYTGQLTNIKTLVTRFMQQHQDDPSLAEGTALKAFSKLKANEYLPVQPQLNALVNQVFFNELKESGSASAKSSALGNARGFAAIDTLFPGNQWKGDLNLFFSKLQTIQGGNIDLLVPGGQINAGLAVSFNGSKPSSELGIVAQGQGNINAFVHDDFIVNQSRVFALSSGDILVWSSEGDIDAGRGAKSAIAAPPPIISFDKNGNMAIEFPPIVSGSGIRTAATFGDTPGDVFLFAPKGVVNAGEAGIGGTNVTISATAVLGANNIQVGGIGTGVPVASTGSLAAGLTGVSNLNANVSQVAQAAADTSKNNAEKATKDLKLGTLSVDILGFGDSNSSQGNDDKRHKSKSSS